MRLGIIWHSIAFPSKVFPLMRKLLSNVLILLKCVHCSRYYHTSVVSISLEFKTSPYPEIVLFFEVRLSPTKLLSSITCSCNQFVIFQSARGISRLGEEKVSKRDDARVSKCTKQLRQAYQELSNKIDMKIKSLSQVLPSRFFW